MALPARPRGDEQPQRGLEPTNLPITNRLRCHCATGAGKPTREWRSFSQNTKAASRRSPDTSLVSTILANAAAAVNTNAGVGASKSRPVKRALPPRETFAYLPLRETVWRITVHTSWDLLDQRRRPYGHLVLTNATSPGSAAVGHLDYEQLRRVHRVAPTAHPCYYVRVTTTPEAQTIRHPNMEHHCSILFRPVPPQIRTVEHPLFHFSAKCSIAQIGMEHFGTQWNSSHGEPTAPLNSE